MKLYYSTPNNPYLINDDVKTSFYFVCSAGINRSSTTREHLKSIVKTHHIFHPTFGADLTDYQAADWPPSNQGFKDYFGVEKQHNIQSLIYEQIRCKYPLTNLQKQQFDELIDKYWTFDPNFKQVIIITVDDPCIFELFKKQFEDQDCDLVLIDAAETIYRPDLPNIKSLTKEAYAEFVNKISKYFNIQ